MSFQCWHRAWCWEVSLQCLLWHQILTLWHTWQFFFSLNSDAVLNNGKRGGKIWMLREGILVPIGTIGQNFLELSKFLNLKKKKVTVPHYWKEIIFSFLKFRTSNIIHILPQPAGIIHYLKLIQNNIMLN